MIGAYLQFTIPVAFSNSVSVWIYERDRNHRTRYNVHRKYLLYPWLPLSSKSSRIGCGGHVCQDFETRPWVHGAGFHALNNRLISTHDNTEVVVTSLKSNQPFPRGLIAPIYGSSHLADLPILIATPPRASTSATQLKISVFAAARI